MGRTEGIRLVAPGTEPGEENWRSHARVRAEARRGRLSAQSWLRDSAPLLAEGGDREGKHMLRLVAQARGIILAQAAELRRMEELSLLDELTTLYNRRGLARQLRAALLEARRTGIGGAFIYLDLDQFKLVNDRYGHAAGDAVLRQVATYLVKSVREHDCVARLGGDEFAVILTRIHSREGVQRAREIGEGLNRIRTVFEGQEIRVGASVGVVPFGLEDSEQRLLALADRQMYREKGARRTSEGDGLV